MAEYSISQKEEEFCLAIVSGLGIGESHAKAYPNNMSEKSHQEAGSRLMKKSKIIARIQELRREAANFAEITLEGHLADLSMLREMALAEGNLNAAIRSEIARGRHSGVVVTKSELTGPGGAPLVPSTVEVIIASPKSGD